MAALFKNLLRWYYFRQDLLQNFLVFSCINVIIIIIKKLGMTLPTNPSKTDNGTDTGLFGLETKLIWEYIPIGCI